MPEFKKSFVSGFKYNDLTPHIPWGRQFVNWSRIDSHVDEEMRVFAKKLAGTVLRQKAIELVRSHTVPD